MYMLKSSTGSITGSYQWAIEQAGLDTMPIKTMKFTLESVISISPLKSPSYDHYQMDTI